MQTLFVDWLGLGYKEFGKSSFGIDTSNEENSTSLFIYYLCLYECDTNFTK